MRGSVWGIVLAGGGNRCGGLKQFELLGDRRVLDWSQAVARAACDGVVVVRPLDRLVDGHHRYGGVAADPDRDDDALAEGLIVAETPDRSTLVAVQTPQGFRASVLREAHATGAEATDDAALVEAIGGKVVTVDGDRRNPKLITRDDVAVALALVGRPS